MPLGFVVASLLTVLLVYTALYWASLIIILKPLIIYLASVNATGLRPVLNYQVFIIWLTSPFNAYGSLIFHYPPWLYFIESVIVPTVILTAEVIIALWASEYMLGRPVLNELFFVSLLRLGLRCIVHDITHRLDWVW